MPPSLFPMVPVLSSAARIPLPPSTMEWAIALSSACWSADSAITVPCRFKVSLILGVRLVELDNSKVPSGIKDCRWQAHFKTHREGPRARAVRKSSGNKKRRWHKPLATSSQGYPIILPSITQQPVQCARSLVRLQFCHIRSLSWMIQSFKQLNCFQTVKLFSNVRSDCSVFMFASTLASAKTNFLTNVKSSK